MAAASSTAPVKVTTGEISDDASPYELEQFEVLRELGTGSFGVVKEVRRNGFFPEIFAMKVLDKQRIIERRMQEQLRREVITQLKVRHPHVVQMLWYFEQKSKVYCLLEYADSGQLFRFLRSHVSGLPEPRAARFFADIARGLEYLHGKRIVHRDLKPENVLLFGPDMLAKIGDLGWCVPLTDEEPARRTFCGTLDYLAPEMLKGDLHGLAVDLWALGVLLFEMLVARAPFTVNSQKGTMDNICAGHVDIPLHVSLAATVVIRGLLVQDPRARTSAARVLQEPWVANAVVDAAGDAALDDTQPVARNARHSAPAFFSDPALRGETVHAKTGVGGSVAREFAASRADAAAFAKFACPSGLSIIGEPDADVLGETLCVERPPPAKTGIRQHAPALGAPIPVAAVPPLPLNKPANAVSSAMHQQRLGGEPAAVDGKIGEASEDRAPPTKTSEEWQPLSVRRGGGGYGRAHEAPTKEPPDYDSRASVGSKSSVVDSDLLSTVDDSRVSVEDVDDQLLTALHGGLPWQRKHAGISTYGEFGRSEKLHGVDEHAPLTAPALDRFDRERVEVRTVPKAKMRSTRRSTMSNSSAGSEVSRTIF